MSSKSRKRMYPFFSTKQIIRISLIISIGFSLLYTFTFFFGESLFLSAEKSAPMPNKWRPPFPPQSDTLQTAYPQHFEKFRPRRHNEMRFKSKQFRASRTAVHVATSFVLLFVLFLYNRKIMEYNFSRKWHETCSVVSGSVLITMTLSISLSYLILNLDPYTPGPRFHFRMIRDCLVRDYTLMAVVVMAAYLLRALYNQKMIAVENEELKTENIRSHYEALKNQLDPHFLFNSMNTLQSLIDLDKDKAGDFVHQLSSVLRYTLQNKEVVTLADEMACVRDYCAMMQIRYGDNLKVEIEVDPKYGKYKVLPFAIQGLVENAIKHNVVSSKQPLVIHIVTDDEAHLKVSNRRQPKQDDCGNGIGLSNLAERYRLQWDKDVLVCDDGTRFEVVLQLIEN